MPDLYNLDFLVNRSQLMKFIYPRPRVLSKYNEITLITYLHDLVEHSLNDTFFFSTCVEISRCMRFCWCSDRDVVVSERDTLLSSTRKLSWKHTINACYALRAGQCDTESGSSLE